MQILSDAYLKPYTFRIKAKSEFYNVSWRNLVGRKEIYRFSPENLLKIYSFLKEIKKVLSKKDSEEKAPTDIT